MGHSLGWPLIKLFVASICVGKLDLYCEFSGKVKDLGELKNKKGVFALFDSTGAPISVSGGTSGIRDGSSCQIDLQSNFASP
jgi:hypothetical protein